MSIYPRILQIFDGTARRIAILGLLMIVCGIVPLGRAVVQTAEASHTPSWTDFNTHDPGIVVAVGGSAEQGAVLLIGNPDGVVPACHFSGVLRVDDSAPPFGSGLKDLMFEPVSLAPGESRAIDVSFMPEAGEGARQELILRIENDKTGRSPCPLLVQVIGYDSGSRATEFVADWINLSYANKPVAKTAIAPAEPVKSPLPLGFVGGNGGQVGLFLISEINRPLPVGPCELIGEVIAETVPRHDTAGTAISGHALQKSWPIEWKGPDLKKSALVEIPFAEFGATPDLRVDVRLSLRLQRPVPPACFGGLIGSLQIVDQTGKTRAVLPADRVFFNINHFKNTPFP